MFTSFLYEHSKTYIFGGNFLIAIAHLSPQDIKTVCEKRMKRLKGNEKNIEGIEMVNVATKSIRSIWLYRIRITKIAMKQKNISEYFEILVKLKN